MGRAIPCPKCAALETVVVDARLRPSGYFQRRRRCTQCETRFNTREVYASQTAENPKENDIADQLKRLADLHERMGQVFKTGAAQTGRGKIVFTAEMDRALRDGLAQGHSQATISNTIGVDASVIRRRCRELGLASQRPWAFKRKHQPKENSDASSD